MTRATLFTAMQPYDDPWHDFDATSDELAALLAERGIEVDRPASLEAIPASIATADLLVVNTSADQYLEAEEWPEFADALAAFVARGGRLLSMHASLLAFQAVPLWAELIGTRWNHPISMHPQKGWALVQVAEAPSPITAGLEPFSIYDERYSKTVNADDNTELLFHTMEGDRHPLVWTRTHGDARVVVDALGHGVESYDSVEHRVVLHRALDWLLA